MSHQKERKPLHITMGNIQDVVELDDEGWLRWKERPREFFKCDRDWRSWNQRYAGMKAGTLPNRRNKRLVARVRVGGETYTAGRLAWYLINGYWPDGHIRHINGDSTDNRPKNLYSMDPGDTSQFCAPRPDWPERKSRDSIHWNMRNLHRAYVSSPFGGYVTAPPGMPKAEAVKLGYGPTIEEVQNRFYGKPLKEEPKRLPPMFDASESGPAPVAVAPEPEFY